eukprot:30666-Pelagococcus_subviridis.AAC.2
MITTGAARRTRARALSVDRAQGQESNFPASLTRPRSAAPPGPCAFACRSHEAPEDRFRRDQARESRRSRRRRRRCRGRARRRRRRARRCFPAAVPLLPERARKDRRPRHRRSRARARRRDPFPTRQPTAESRRGCRR